MKTDDRAGREQVFAEVSVSVWRGISWLKGGRLQSDLTLRTICWRKAVERKLTHILFRKFWMIFADMMRTVFTVTILHVSRILIFIIAYIVNCGKSSGKGKYIVVFQRENTELINIQYLH